MAKKKKVIDDGAATVKRPNRGVLVQKEALDRLDAWRQAQLVPPNRSACVSAAIAAWLDSVGA